MEVVLLEGGGTAADSSLLLHNGYLHTGALQQHGGRKASRAGSDDDYPARTDTSQSGSGDICATHFSFVTPHLARV